MDKFDTIDQNSGGSLAIQVMYSKSVNSNLNSLVENSDIYQYIILARSLHVMKMCDFFIVLKLSTIDREKERK